MTAYKTVNGVNYRKDAPAEVIKVLDKYIKSSLGPRIRIFYGNPKTGEDEGAISKYLIGRIVRSADTPKIPLIWPTENHVLAYNIEENRIVRITEFGKNVYVHPTYRCDVEVKGKTVYLNGKVHSRTESHERALKVARYLKGQINTI